MALTISYLVMPGSENISDPEKGAKIVNSLQQYFVVSITFKIGWSSVTRGGK